MSLTASPKRSACSALISWLREKPISLGMLAGLIALTRINSVPRSIAAEAVKLFTPALVAR